MPKKEGSLNKFTHVWRRMKVFKNWWMIVFPLTRLISRPDRTMELRQGGRMYLRNIFASDFYVTMEIFDRDDYGLSRLSLAPGAVILDVGANIGAFTVFAATRFPMAKILSFEPERENMQTLTTNVQLNGFSNVTVFHQALAAQDGRARLAFDPKDNASHTLEGSADSPQTQEIETVSLRTVLEREHLNKIDVLKLDIEGTEYDVLMRDPQTLDHIDRILLEVHEHPHHTPAELLEFLARTGFEVAGSPTRSNVFFATRKPSVA